MKPDGAAQRLTPLLEEFAGSPLPVRLRAWDGSETAPGDSAEDAPLLVLRSRRALRRLLWQPGELGLAEAYITGDLDVEGDLAEALRTVWRTARAGGLRPPRPTPRAAARAFRVLLGLGAVGPRPPAPALRSRPKGRLHSRDRDREAVSHHYDFSNDFYALLLDESMAYSCGYWRRPGDRAYSLADAQHDKLELVCRKLDLHPGARFLDVGCGWGSLTLHAARHYKARVTAVTLAREQAAAVTRRVREEGLEDLVDVQLRDYRDIEPGTYDAVSSIEMGEHVGDAGYPAFAASLHQRLRPRGRLLVQQMSRGRNAPGGGAFIETYIAPDMHMRPLGETVSLLEGASLEVRGVESLREDYVRTIAAWRRTLEERWSEVTALIGTEAARVWRLYLVGGMLAFEEGRMGVDQILAVRPDAEGRSGMSGGGR
ncbi:cyclopropane-fatty-acyl-phospholipid synthase family protein [Streptomyces sp. WMMB 322]|uniref:SAM-dependent methyltransferase n=1 Tax=Streptomyces sp. WMMB 322 TaxID=1286821 RepID=UPI0006E3E49D|nr:cyclopropane-fatty-acyl-phospholipid synthase family protein [Streptomyces sp. WMMB 322]SCK35558.1 cyclopropane-fatty-acyl-phospholipid synthase [Streptomyces sp. WMMB 322]